MCNIIIILILTLNVVINQLHAGEFHSGSPDWTELQFVHNGDGHIHFLSPSSMNAIRDNISQISNASTQYSSMTGDEGWASGYDMHLKERTPTPPASSTTKEDGWLTYGSGAASSSSNSPKGSCYAQKLQQHQQNQPPFLKEGMWGTGDYVLPKYDKETSQLIPLTKEMVRTPFFVTLEGATVGERTALLEMAAYHPNNSESYIIQRYNMTAVILSGPVDIPAIQKRRKKDDLWNGFLVKTTCNNDLFLAQLLLENGANVHERNSLFRVTPIFFARTVPFARLLIKHGALNHPLCIKDLLRSAAAFDSPDFITEYIANGLDPMVRSEYGHTPLTGCIEDPQELTSQNALCLLAHLPAHKVRTLLNNPSCERESVFECITRKKKSYKKKPYYREQRTQLKALFTVLMKAGKDAGMSATLFEDCPLCLSMLCKKPMRTTLCEHTFHAECIGSLATCPLCRANLMDPDAEQYRKNQMLINARFQTPGNTAEQHQEWKKNILKALQLDAHIRSVQKKFANEGWWTIDLLQAATAIGDCELMQQMIECGADVHECGTSSNTPIFNAHDLPEAELLVSYGALNNSHIQQNLLFNLGNVKYKPELITYYRKLGLKPTQPDPRNNMSALMYFVCNVSVDTCDRIQRLLKGLSPAAVSTILATQDNSKETIFDYIEEEKRDCEGLPHLLDQLDLIEQYLRAVEKDPSLPSQS